MGDQVDPALRTSVALIEKVSPFPITPPDRYKGVSQTVYQISPNPRPQKHLRREAEGIKRKMCSFEGEEACRLKADPILRSVVMTAYKEVKNLLSEERQDLDAEMRELISWKKTVENRIMLRSVVEAWIRLEEGRLLNRVLVSTINENYAKLVDKGTSWRKCKDNNLYKEVKCLLKMIEYGQEDSCNEYMDSLKQSIEKQTSLPGQEFVDLLNVYLDCNKAVHIDWDVKKLNQAIEKTRSGEFSFKDRKLNQWVLKMIREISRKNGFGDLGISDGEIATGLDIDAI